MVSPDVVGIGSEHFVVYFLMYIVYTWYVRLIMSGYLFFCIYFNVWYLLEQTIYFEVFFLFFCRRKNETEKRNRIKYWRRVLEPVLASILAF